MTATKQAPEELDLHGRTVDEALPLLDEFLYAAFKARLLRVWVIHGKGTGVLRQAVRRRLQNHTLVRTCVMADGRRGGHGATQVDLVDR